MVASDDGGVYYLENMLVFAAMGPMLVVLHFMMMQQERVRQVRVRRGIRRAFVFLVAAYAIYTLLVVCDLAENALDLPP